MKKFNWKLIPLNLCPGLLILLSFAVSKATISNNLSLPDIFNLLGMLLCFAAPITVGVLNIRKCTRVMHFNLLQLILFVATIGANELHTKLWLAYISNDSDSSFVGFLGTLALGTAIVIITIEGNKKLKKDKCDNE